MRRKVFSMIKFQSAKENLWLYFALAFIAVLGFVAFQSVEKVTNATANRAKSRQTLLSLANLTSTLREAESSQRGYLLTSNDAFIIRFQSAKESVPIQINEILASLSENTKNADSVRMLGKLISERLAELDRTLELSQTKGIDKAVAVIHARAESELMNQIRLVTAEIEASKKQDLQEATLIAERSLYSSPRWIAIAGIAAFLLLLGTGGFLNLTKRRRNLAESDLRDHEKANIELTKSQIEYQSRIDVMLKNIDAVIWSTDAHGIYNFYEGNAASRLGIDSKERIGQNAFTLNSSRPDVLKAIKEALSGKSTAGVTAEVNGRWFRSGMSPIFNSFAEVTGVVGFSYDITDQKTAEAARSALEVREGAAIEASKLKSEFLANMSHEIRTPINGVIGMTNLLLESNLTFEQKEYASMVRSSADILLTLVNDILDLSKAEAGKIELEMLDFSLEHVVKDIERMLSHSAKNKGLKLLKSMPTDLPQYINGDPTRLRQILVNLVNNSIKFTSEGQIVIEVSNEKQTSNELVLRFEVSDTGIGIPQTALGRLFKSFSQADSSTTRRFGGTGLGLSISKRLVESMNGEIGVRSTEGKGSTFWFTIPFKLGKSIRGRDSFESVTTVDSKRSLRVLVAEDNSVNQVIAKKMIEKMGHSVLIAANGIEALDALRTSSFDLVLMDCQMPELDGYEATQTIRVDRSVKNPNVPIIAMTANAMNGDREKCLAAGMNDYISKPVREKDLQVVIDRVLVAAVKRTA
ncbi:MAG: ATP-binding protein [Bdellovibrionota bacterium]